MAWLLQSTLQPDPAKVACEWDLQILTLCPTHLPHQLTCIHIVCLAPCAAGIYMAPNEQSSAYMPGCPLLLLGNMLPSTALHVLSVEKMYLVTLVTPFSPLHFGSYSLPIPWRLCWCCLLCLPQPTLHAPLNLPNTCWSNNLPRPTPHHGNLSVHCGIFQFVNFNLFPNDVKKCLTASLGKLGWTKSSLQEL